MYVRRGSIIVAMAYDNLDHMNNLRDGNLNMNQTRVCKTKEDKDVTGSGKISEQYMMDAIDMRCADIAWYSCRDEEMFVAAKENLDILLSKLTDMWAARNQAASGTPSLRDESVNGMSGQNCRRGLWPRRSTNANSWRGHRRSTKKAVVQTRKIRKVAEITETLEKAEVSRHSKSSSTKTTSSFQYGHRSSFTCYSTIGSASAVFDDIVIGKKIDGTPTSIDETSSNLNQTTGVEVVEEEMTTFCTSDWGTPYGMP